MTIEVLSIISIKSNKKKKIQSMGIQHPSHFNRLKFVGLLGCLVTIDIDTCLVSYQQYV